MTTLRRYIRSGRLSAEKAPGRYGPEYLISAGDLADAGLEVETVERSGLPARRGSTLETGSSAMTRIGAYREAVPLSLYQELQMKHEQLLVQYGMVRAGGLRMMRLQAELEQRTKQLEDARLQLQRVERHSREHRERSERKLREAALELEGRALEIAALKEKVKALEIVTRNAGTSETIEKQFRGVMAQAERVDRLVSPRKWKTVIPRETGRKPPEH